MRHHASLAVVFFLLKYDYYFVCMVFAFVYVCGRQKRVLGPLELELQAVVSHLTKVQEIELGSSGRAVMHT